jgi:small-conductance mechanosensitive channel/CRP-like cAMP-binding protein
VNRHIRGKLLVSAAAFALYAAADLALVYGHLSPALQQQIRTFQPLVLAFGFVIAAVPLALNPWREDRTPERFPEIVQDVILIAALAIAATFVLQDRIFAATAVGAVVIGFALQDTLGNLFAGLAIQIEKPFRVGNWIKLADLEGVVAEITWRATKIRTLAGNLVVVPNSVLARDTITNYSQPTADMRVEVEVGASYDSAPGEVKSVIVEALKGQPLLSHSRRPEVLLIDFAASAITYRVRIWTTQFPDIEYVRDRVRTCIYYAFRRHGITIPYPIQVQMSEESAVGFKARALDLSSVLDSVEIFAPLAPAKRAQLLTLSQPRLYGAGEIIVHQGEPGSSMFVLARGEAVVTIDGAEQEVARFKAGGFFGEMSLLAGELRSATVRAATDCDLIEITLPAFQQFVLGEPDVLDQIGMAVATRRAELDRHRAASAAAHNVTEPASSFVERIRRFLRVSAVG